MTKKLIDERSEGSTNVATSSGNTKLSWSYNSEHRCFYCLSWIELLQKHEDGTTKPIGCRSRSQTDAERQYNTIQREFPATAWAVLLLHPYLEGIKFTVGTDHNSLK